MSGKLEVLGADLVDLRVVPNGAQRRLQPFDVLTSGAHEEVDILRRAHHPVKVDCHAIDEDVLDSRALKGADDIEEHGEVHRRSIAIENVARSRVAWATRASHSLRAPTLASDAESAAATQGQTRNSIAAVRPMLFGEPKPLSRL